MTNFSVPYGKSQLSFHIDPDFDVEIISPAQVLPIKDADAAIRAVIENPASQKTLEEVNPSATVGIAINDKTRPIPQPNPLLGLLRHLDNLGFKKEAIRLFIGSGTHKPMPEREFEKILPESIYKNYPIISHDCDLSPMVDLGKTKFNTPILINRTYYECDLKITVGNIEPHHFMGFSGGVKTAAIGLAGRETITANHAMLIDEKARSGSYDTNPLRQEVEEIGRKTGIDFTLGTILNEDKQVLKVFFSSPEAVMRAAIPHVRRIFGAAVPGFFDLVIASPGGYPKDINLYQAQKGLTHAARITKDGGCVILTAACPEGSGSRAYEDYISGIQSHEAVLKDFQKGFFQIGPHKAFQIAREAKRINIILVSDIPPEDVQRWKLAPGQPSQINQIIKQHTTQLAAHARIAILPAAARTMTEINNE